MFDATPPNLPIEPPQTAPTSPPAPVPAAAAPQSPPAMPPSSPASVPMSDKSKKEPEDIFSGLDQGTVASLADHAAGEPSTPSRSKWVVIGAIGAGILLLAIIGLVVWRVFFSSEEVDVLDVTPAPVNVSNPPTVPEQVEQPPVIDQTTPEPVTQVPEGTTIPLPTAPTESQPPSSLTPDNQPSALPVEGKDSDGDELTDIEEAFYASDTQKSDTDGDSYPDGGEVKNLFSPLAPGKTLASESFMLKESWNGWSFLLPTPWSLVKDVNVSSQAAITTGSAARMKLEIRSNSSRLSLREWVGGDQVANTMKALQLKNGHAALQSADNLVTYVAAGDMVLIVTYDLNGDPAYEYRTSLQMILNSLVLNP